MEEMRDDLASILIEKKNDYGENIKRNFKLPGELTVEITLAEYRSLVKERGIFDKKESDFNSTLYKKNQEIEEMKKQNASLKEKLLAAMNKQNEQEGE